MNVSYTHNYLYILRGWKGRKRKKGKEEIAFHLYFLSSLLGQTIVRKRRSTGEKQTDVH
jgi:hypothetical protein